MTVMVTVGLNVEQRERPTSLSSWMPRSELRVDVQATIDHRAFPEDSVWAAQIEIIGRDRIIEAGPDTRCADVLFKVTWVDVEWFRWPPTLRREDTFYLRPGTTLFSETMVMPSAPLDDEPPFEGVVRLPYGPAPFRVPCCDEISARLVLRQLTDETPYLPPVESAAVRGLFFGEAPAR